MPIYEYNRVLVMSYKLYIFLFIVMISHFQLIIHYFHPFGIISACNQFLFPTFNVYHLADTELE